MKNIVLTKGYKAIVDDEDFEKVNKYKWQFSNTKKRGKGYAKNDSILQEDGSKKRMYMHRFILGIKDKNIEVDHINGDGLDNRKENLRISNKFTNGSNRSRNNKNNTSGYRGVYWSKKNKRWFASIQHKRKQIFLGYYDDKKDAALAYNRKAKAVFGEFSGELNKIP